MNDKNQKIKDLIDNIKKLNDNLANFNRDSRENYQSLLENKNRIEKEHDERMAKEIKKNNQDIEDRRQEYASQMLEDAKRY
jgi:uncharacterized protein YukE